MKKFLLAAAAALCLLFGGCSLQPASEPLPAEALAQTLPDGLTDSELYLQALESGAAILYNREPITASETTKEAVASLEEDGGRFEIYFFTGEGDSAACDRILYENTDGTITSSASHTDDWTANSEPIPGQSITEPSITRYGFFTARDAGGETMGFQVINDWEIYGNAAELRSLYATYFAPICRTAIGTDTWSSPEEAGDLIMLAEDIAEYVDGISFREEYPDGWIPVNYLVETLSRYFDGITRRSVVYTVYDFDYASDCMHYLYERDYDTALPNVRVLSAHEQDNLLRISYCLYDPHTGEPLPDSTRVLSVAPTEDGGFHYMSNLMA